MSAYNVTTRTEARRIAWAAGADAANRAMRAAGRTFWTAEDADIALETYYGLLTELGYNTEADDIL